MKIYENDQHYNFLKLHTSLCIEEIDYYNIKKHMIIVKYMYFPQTDALFIVSPLSRLLQFSAKSEVYSI